MDWKGLVFASLVDRNAKSKDLVRVCKDYGKALKCIGKLEKRVYELEKDLVAFRSRPSISSDIEIEADRSKRSPSKDSDKTRVLESKLIELQTELSSCYKVINEKSEVAIRLKEQAFADERAVIEMEKKVEEYKTLFDARVQESEGLRVELEQVQSFVEQQNQEISSLRTIQGSLQDTIHRLTMESKMFFEQLMETKNAQAEEMNKMTDLLEQYRKGKIVKESHVETVENPSLLFDALEFKNDFNIAVPRTVNRTFVSILNNRLCTGGSYWRSFSCKV